MSKRVKFGEEYPIPSLDVTELKQPILILVDTSGSMSADIPEVVKAINQMIDEINADPVASRQAEICIVSFNDNATVEVNWKPITETSHVELKSEGCTNLNEGLTLGLEKSLERSHYYEKMGSEVIMPYFITITDGYSNGPAFDTICEELNHREGQKKIRRFTIAVNNYDKTTVAKLSNAKRVLEFVNNSNKNYMEFFNFVTQSIKVVSTSTPGEHIVVEGNLGPPNEGSAFQAPDLSGWLND